MKQIFVHGLGQTPAGWEPLLDLLGAPSDCACPDLTDLLPTGEAAYPGLFDAFSRSCDGWEAPLILCGLSLGGVLSLHYAAEHPERVGTLVLMAPQYRMPKGLLRVQNALFRLMPQTMFRETGFTKTQFMQLCGSMMNLDLSGALCRVACPVLVLCGSRDRANRRAGSELARLLPQAEFRMVEGAGHELNREVPEKLAPLLRDFFARTAPSPGRENTVPQEVL